MISLFAFCILTVYFDSRCSRINDTSCCGGCSSGCICSRCCSGCCTVIGYLDNEATIYKFCIFDSGVVGTSPSQQLAILAVQLFSFERNWEFIVSTVFIAVLQFHVVCSCNALNSCFIRNVVVQCQECSTIFNIRRRYLLTARRRNAPAQSLRAFAPLTKVYKCSCCIITLIGIAVCIQQCLCRCTDSIGLECDGDTFGIRCIVHIQRNFYILIARIYNDIMCIVYSDSRALKQRLVVATSCCNSCGRSCCYICCCCGGYCSSCGCNCCSSSRSGCSCGICFRRIANLNGQEVCLIFQANRINGFGLGLTIQLIRTLQTVHLQDNRFTIFFIRRTGFGIKSDVIITIWCILQHGNIKCNHCIRIGLVIQPLCSTAAAVLHSECIVITIDDFAFRSCRIIVVNNAMICKHRIRTRLCTLLRYFKVISSSMGFFIYIQIQNKFLCNLGTLYWND